MIKMLGSVLLMSMLASSVFGAEKLNILVILSDDQVYADTPPAGADAKPL